MVDYAALRADSAHLLDAPVTAAGLVVLDVGRLAPASGGMAGGLAAESAVSVLGVGDPITDGLAAGAGHAAGQHAVYQSAADAAGVTPVMVLAVTEHELALLDWRGDVRSGTGPTLVLARFARDRATVSSTKSGPTRHLVLAQDGVEARVQCTLGLLSAGKAEMHGLLDALGVD